MTTNGFEVMTSNSTSTFVVTGGSSGIGRATVLELARSGHHVYAAARRERELRALSETNPGITGLRVDVTDPASVVAARSTKSLDYTGTNAEYHKLFTAGAGLSAKLSSAAVPAQEVAQTVARAAIASRPRVRYIPGARNNINVKVLTNAPTRAVGRIKARLMELDPTAVATT